MILASLSYNRGMPSLVLAWLLFVTIPQAPSSAAPALESVTVHARTVLAWLAEKQFSKLEEQFTEPMKVALPLEKLQATWSGLLIQAGAYKSCSAEPRVRAIADKQMVITACEFEHATIDIQIAFDADGRIAGMALRPAAAAVAYAAPSYVNASAFEEKDQTVGAGEWELPGTLSMPIGPGPFPALVLVAGSGPNDRDETIGPNKPFKDLAAGLASRGIAVLRYDKRTKVHGAKFAGMADLTVKQEVRGRRPRGGEGASRQPESQSRACLRARAQSRRDADPADRRRRSVAGAGLIVMAGAARPLEDAILEQTRYIAVADGAISPEEQAQIDDAARLSARVKALTPDDAKSAANIFGAPAAYWLDLRGYDPPSAAKGLKAPLLVLQGERDYQVTMAEFEKWKASLAGRSDVTFHTYPSLNHLFIAGTGKSVPAEYQAPGHVAEPVVTDIAAWILR